MNSTVILFIICILLLYLVILGIAITDYALTAYSLHQIGKKKNIQNSWLSWIPVASSWVLGSITDRIDEKNDHKKHWNKVLLILELVLACGFIFVYIWFLLSVFAVAYSSGSGNTPNTISIISFVLSYLCLIVVCLCGVAWQICHYICIYKIFESTAPNKSIKYLLLNIMVPLAGPICLFKCNKQIVAQQDLIEEQQDQI